MHQPKPTTTAMLSQEGVQVEIINLKNSSSQVYNPVHINLINFK